MVDDRVGVEAAPTTRDLDDMLRWFNERVLARDLAITCVSLEPGTAVVEWDPPEEWRNPNGSLPGAMLAAVADHSAGFASVSVTGQEDYAATVELDIRFLRPAYATPIRSETKVVRRGARLIFLRTEISEPDGTVVADGSASFFVERLPGDRYKIGWQN